MKLFNLVLPVFAFKKDPKSDLGLGGRLGVSVPSSDDGCGPAFSPAIAIFSTISNRLGPQVMANLFLESAKNVDSNLVSSPFSLATQLALLFEAADGETKEQIKKLTLMADNGQMEALKQLKDQYDCMTKGKIVTKNGIFLDNSFQPNADFYKKVQYGGASMYKLDFARNPDLSRIILDSWLSDGKESPLGLPESAISSATSFMMVSGTTFEAKWAIEFAERYPGGFTLPDGKTKMVDMMEVTYPMQHIVSCVDYPQYDDCEPNKAIPTMVQIPLERTEGEQASRLQVIAIKPNKILPKQAIIALSPEYFHQLWLPASDANLNTCKLRIPQVDIESQSELSNALYGLGIEDAFIPFKANFTKMSDNSGISLTNIYQNSFLKWDTEGAAAGVASQLTIKLPYSSRGGIKEYHDHEISFSDPFVVFITDRKTKTNLFIGVVNDPR